LLISDIFNHSALLDKCVKRDVPQHTVVWLPIDFLNASKQYDMHFSVSETLSPCALCLKKRTNFETAV